MPISDELKNMFFLLHDAIVDLADDNKWCKDFTKDFDDCIKELEKEV